jgi:hypothetical protein
MERAEAADTDVRNASSAHEAVVAQMQELTAKRDAAFSEIDEAVAQRTPQRAQLAESVPADLLALYERARAHGGTGAAMLRQRRCEACHIELSGSELASVRAAAEDTVVRCDNCRAVLVRTAESGL